VIGDRYRLDEPIGSGGMGDVWQASDTVLGRRVAVKLLDARRADDPGFQTRFRHEARAMAMLHNPGVADVYDYGETADGGTAYIVMAYVDGQPLNRRLTEHGRLDPAETMSIVAHAARALHAAHTAGIVHRDVKPGNLIVRPDGTVALVDFGVARSASSAAITGVDEVIGTALYIAPEQVAKDSTGPATDIYSLGAVAYHCLAGHPPYPGSNPLTVALRHLNDDPPPLPPDAPAPVRDLVATAMSKDPADRFPDASAMAEAADAAISDADAPTESTLPLPALPAEPAPGAEPAGPSGPSRRKAAAWALASLGLAAAVALALAVPGILNPGPPGPGGPSPSRPPATAGVGEAGQPGPGTAGGSPTRPGATPTGAGEQPAEPTGSEPAGPDPAATGEPEPTPPAEEEDPDPTERAEDPEATPEAVGTVGAEAVGAEAVGAG
jgi:serine/threonine-protein kinase